MTSRAAGEYPPVPEPLAVPGVDTHTHLDMCTGVRGPIKDGEPAPEVQPDEGEDYPSLDFFYDTAMQVGIRRIVQIGCDLPASRWTLQTVREQAKLGRDWMLGGAAIHPNEAPRLAAAGILDDALTEIEALCTADARMRVVGETGLDYFRTAEAEQPAQWESFRAHCEIAKRHDLVLQIHDRHAHADVLRILDDIGAPEKTVLHCFSGDADFARECAARGFYMSFAGNATFKNAADLREACRAVPAELLLTETDAPFLTPHPYRGKPGGPYLTAVTLATLAEVRGASVEQVAEQSTANAEAVFGAWELASAH